MLPGRKRKEDFYSGASLRSSEGGRARRSFGSSNKEVWGVGWSQPNGHQRQSMHLRGRTIGGEKAETCACIKHALGRRQTGGGKLSSFEGGGEGTARVELAKLCHQRQIQSILDCAKGCPHLFQGPRCRGQAGGKRT